MSPLERAIAAELKPLGYKKKDLTWRRRVGDVTLVLNLQGSAFGDDVYVNLAMYHHALGDEAEPSERRCHIRARLDQIVPATYSEAIKGANKAGEPPSELMKAVRVFGLPWLESLATGKGRAAFLSSPSAKRCAVVQKVVSL